MATPNDDASLRVRMIRLRHRLRNAIGGIPDVPEECKSQIIAATDSFTWGLEVFFTAAENGESLDRLYHVLQEFVKNESNRTPL